jgi:hypothetical protein
MRATVCVAIVVAKISRAQVWVQPGATCFFRIFQKPLIGLLKPRKCRTKLVLDCSGLTLDAQKKGKKPGGYIFYR